MHIPLKYSMRSLMQRPLRSVLTVAGVGLTVFLSVMMLGLSRGLLHTTLSSGDELNVIVMSKGAEALEFSAIDPAALNILSTSMGLARQDGQPLARPEVYINSLVTVAGGNMDLQPVLVRGLLDATGCRMHGQVNLTEGDWPDRGYKIAVGPLVATRLGLPPGAIGLGDVLEFEGEAWEVSGLLSAPGTVFEAEIWTQVDDLMVASRHDDYSSVLLRAADLTSREELLYDLRTRTDVRSTPEIETDYYTADAVQVKPVQAVALIMSVLLICGGLMAGMNTMFNSIMGRTREMAVLLVMGYNRAGVLLGFTLESVSLCLVGGVVGCAIGVLLNDMPMKFSMSAFRFQIDSLVITAGISIALVIGVLGALVPVLRVARLQAVDGLKHV